MGLIVALINGICYACYGVLFLRALISWFELSPYSPGARAVIVITEPALKPLRRLLEPLQGRSGLDFSPLAVFLVIEILRQTITRALV